MRVGHAVGIALLLLFGSPLHAAELNLNPPPKPFDSYPKPPFPDYAKREAWVVWPGHASAADDIPAGLKGEIPSKPKADVFFIHPTTFLTNTAWNAKYDEGDFAKTQLEQDVLRYQTSVFNGCCRIYAPRYRQATLSAFLNPGDDANKAFDLAYSDVLRAFDTYVANQNRGRPFVLASHSQGSLHATRLIQERIINDAKLRKRLVAAYVVGASLPSDPKFTGLPVCTQAKQTGCLVDWNSAASVTVMALGRRQMITFADGKYQPVGNKTWLCVNPLSWDSRTISPPSANMGSLPFAGVGKPMPGLVAGVTGARCERGRLIISIPRKRRSGFTDTLTVLGSYHNQDYNLFYESVRRNAIERVKAFE